MITVDLTLLDKQIEAIAVSNLTEDIKAGILELLCIIDLELKDSEDGIIEIRQV